MYYFSIYDLNDEHLGFLIMENDENEPFGQFIIKQQSANQPQNQRAVQTLQQLENSVSALYWENTGDEVILRQQDEIIGGIHQQFLTLNEQNFIINELSGY